MEELIDNVPLPSDVKEVFFSSESLSASVGACVRLWGGGVFFFFSVASTCLTRVHNCHTNYMNVKNN